MRSSNILSANLNDLCNNLVCYPKMHFVYPSLATGSSQSLTKSVLQKEAQLHDMINWEKKIGVTLMYRGRTSHFDVVRSLEKIIDEQPKYC